MSPTVTPAARKARHASNAVSGVSLAVAGSAMSVRTARMAALMEPPGGLF
jgi:hypothetical protein